jgi:hypothetical protein
MAQKLFIKLERKKKKHQTWNQGFNDENHFLQVTQLLLDVATPPSNFSCMLFNLPFSFHPWGSFLNTLNSFHVFIVWGTLSWVHKL